MRMILAILMLALLLGSGPAHAAEAPDAAMTPWPEAPVTETVVPGLTDDADATLVAQSCCKHCSKGKPCGDSCIAKDKQCRQPPGCACLLELPDDPLEERP